MSDAQLPNWFIAKYNAEVALRAQQRERRLAGAVTSGGTFMGDYVYFPRIGSVEMYDSHRMAQLALANASQDWINFHCKPKFAAFGVWDPDKNKLSIQAASEYARVLMAAANRAEDKLIVDQLNNAAINGVQGVDANNANIGAVDNITTLGDYNTVVDLDLLSTAIAQLGTNEMFEGEELTWVTPFKVKVQTGLDPYKVFSNVNNDDLPWNQLSHRTYERLYDNNGTPAVPATSTGVDTYLFARSAVVSDYNNEMTEINERWGIALTDVMGKWFQAGAGVREPKGVIRIKSKYNFNIARTGMPFHNV